MTQAMTHNVPPARKEPTIKEFFSSPDIQAKLQNVAGKAFDGPRLIQAALLAINRTPGLQKCISTSLLDCVMVGAQNNWTIGGPRPGMYMVPYYDSRSGNTIATPIPSYYGLQQTARDAANIEIEADVVYATDEFSYRKGLLPELSHVPMGDIDDANITHAYAIARFPNGMVKFEVMNKAAIDKIRTRSKASQKGPWVTDYAEMCKKTVVRRLTKYLPASPKLDAAIELSDNADMIDTTATEVPPKNDAPMRTGRMNMRGGRPAAPVPFDLDDSFSPPDDSSPPGPVSGTPEAGRTPAPASETNPAAATSGAAPVKGRGGRPRSTDTTAAPPSSSKPKANAGDPDWIKMSVAEIKALYNPLTVAEQQDYWLAASDEQKAHIRAALTAPDEPEPAEHEGPTDEDLIEEMANLSHEEMLAYANSDRASKFLAQAKKEARLQGSVDDYSTEELQRLVRPLKKLELQANKAKR